MHFTEKRTIRWWLKNKEVYPTPNHSQVLIKCLEKIKTIITWLPTLIFKVENRRLWNVNLKYQIKQYLHHYIHLQSLHLSSITNQNLAPDTNGAFNLFFKCSNKSKMHLFHVTVCVCVCVCARVCARACARTQAQAHFKKNIRRKEVQFWTKHFVFIY